jgi:competence protein ComEC
MGFLLSVAATLGIALLGPPLIGILAGRLPAWLAVAVAVPGLGRGARRGRVDG